MRLLVTGTVIAVMAAALTAGAAAQPPVPNPPVPDPCWTLPGEPPLAGCIPQPTPLDPDDADGPEVPTPPSDDTSDGSGGDDGPGGVTGWIVDGITNAINSFFRGLVTDALNPLLDLLGRTLLTTPTVESLPRVGELWESSRVFAVAAYVLLVMVAGLVLMAHETVQTRYSVKEIAPRIVVGFLTANLSLFLAGQAISFANAASYAVLGEGVDPESAADTLTTMVMSSLTDQGIFVIFIGLALAAALVALLITYVVRVALTVILIAGAPLALACHGLPQTEGVARWWWRAFFGVLAIQLGQSLALVTALNVFFAPGGFTVFGPTTDGLVNLITTLALFYILIKIPFWVLQQIQVSSGRSFAGSLVKGFIAYKTFGLLRGRGGQRPPRGGGPSSPGGGGGARPGGRPGGRPPGTPPAAGPAAPTGPTPSSPRPPHPRVAHAATDHRHPAGHRHHLARTTDTSRPGERQPWPGAHPLPSGAHHADPPHHPWHDAIRGDHVPAEPTSSRHRLHPPAGTRRAPWPHPADHTAAQGGRTSRHLSAPTVAHVPGSQVDDDARPFQTLAAGPRPHHVLRPHTPPDPSRASRTGGETG